MYHVPDYGVESAWKDWDTDQKTPVSPPPVIQEAEIVEKVATKPCQQKGLPCYVCAQYEATIRLVRTEHPLCSICFDRHLA